jgi:hypothetical protein
MAMTKLQRSMNSLNRPFRPSAVLALAASATMFAPAWSQDHGRHSGIAFESPEAVMEILRHDPNVRIQSTEGWTIAEAFPTIWTFTQTPHPAHPAVVERHLHEVNGGWYVGMRVLCGGPKSACDDLVAAFQGLNEQMRSEVESRLRRESGERREDR